MSDSWLGHLCEKQTGVAKGKHLSSDAHTRVGGGCCLFADSRAKMLVPAAGGAVLDAIPRLL